jgi:hypothetical protein
MTMVWVEHPDLEDSLHQVPMERFEKNLGMKGWRISDAPKPSFTAPPEERPDPMEVRRQQLADVPAATDREDPAEIRRKELAKVKPSTAPPPASARAEEMRAAQAAAALTQRPDPAVTRREELAKVTVPTPKDLAAVRREEMRANRPLLAENDPTGGEETAPKKPKRAKKKTAAKA